MLKRLIKSKKKPPVQEKKQEKSASPAMGMVQKEPVATKEKTSAFLGIQNAIQEKKKEKA